MTDEIRTQLSAFFDKTISTHGATPQGLDWNGVDAHERRLHQVAQAVRAPAGFSVNDFGCGYGAFADYLARLGHRDFDYHGYDVSPKMIETARARTDAHRRQFHVSDIAGLQRADYTVASGVFNKIMTPSRATWMAYVKDHLRAFHAASDRAFACNFLTGYSDPDRMRDDLFYPDPRELFDFCMGLSPWVALSHDYGLYDFTLVVRKVVEPMPAQGDFS